jgi:FkbM family methyltransferase
MDNINKQKHFLDIGANCGNTFDYFLDSQSDLFGCTVWCFEPSPRYFTRLLDRTKLSSSKFNIRICPFGLGGKTETMRFYEKDHNDVSDSFFNPIQYFGTPIKDPKYLVIGSIVSISEFIKMHIPSEDEIILKVDCEGAEFALYEDLLNNPNILKQVTKIYNEWHPSWGHFNEEELNRATNIVNRISTEHNLTLDVWPF